MKFKLFNLLTVFLATSGLLAPAKAATVGSRLEQQMNLEKTHLVCVKQAQHLLCDVEGSGERKARRVSPLDYRQESLNQGAVKSAKATQIPKSSTVNVPLSPAAQGTISAILLGFIYLFLPFGLSLGLFLYEKYYVYRDAVLKEQIELLERLWQHGSDNDATTDKGREA